MKDSIGFMILSDFRGIRRVISTGSEIISIVTMMRNANSSVASGTPIWFSVIIFHAAMNGIRDDVLIIINRNPMMK